MSSTVIGPANPQDRLKDAARDELRAWINADWNTQPESVARFPTSGTHRFSQAVDRAAAVFTVPVIKEAITLTRDSETALKQKQPGVALQLGERAMLLMDSMRGVGREKHTYGQWDAAVDARFNAAKALAATKDDAKITLALAQLPSIPAAVPDGSTFDTLTELRQAIQPWASSGSTYDDPLGPMWHYGANVVDLPFRANLGKDRYSSGVRARACAIHFAIEKGKERDTLLVVCLPLYKDSDAGMLTAYPLGSTWPHTAVPSPLPIGYGKVTVTARPAQQYSTRVEDVGRFFTGSPITYRVRSITSATEAFGKGGNANSQLLINALSDAGYKRLDDRSVSRLRSIPKRAFATSDYGSITQLWTPGE